MVASQILSGGKSFRKPHARGYPETVKTIGEHIRKKRMDSELFQSDIAALFGVTEDTVTGLENNRHDILIRYYLAIISFLGYIPFKLDYVTFRGKLYAFRCLHGETTQQFGGRFGVHSTTVQSCEKGENPPTKGRLKKLLELLKTVNPPG